MIDEESVPVIFKYTDHATATSEAYEVLVSVIIKIDQTDTASILLPTSKVPFIEEVLDAPQL